MSLIEFKNITKIYQPNNELALKNVSFTVEHGEFVCLVGPSGEGKSTILKLIAGLEQPTEGTVHTPKRVSMVFQTMALMPWLTVLQNVELGLKAYNMTDEHAKKIALHHIDMLGLAHLVDKRPIDLSGGQRQRVGIARALAIDPHVLLLDEPFSALDPKTTAELHDDLLKIWNHTKKTIVMVSHVIEEAVSLADKVLLIKKYKIANTFNIDLPYPRREQAIKFTEEVAKIRREFFK